MSRKLALKKLKSSDLSFFKSYLRTHPQTKQKGFNLDSRILGVEFFPGLRAVLEPLPKKKTNVDLTFFGPGLAPEHVLARKIKIDSKNFRLNGEYVDGPVEQLDRYDNLSPGDFAVMEFSGAVVPEVVRVVLIAAADDEDSSLHHALQGLLPDPTASMRVLTEADLEAVVEVANPSAEHPIREWLDTVLLEEVGSGDAGAVEQVNKRRPGRGLTPAEFQISKEAAERTGRLGEELLDHYFTERHPGLTHDWTASTNAISPFDFIVTFEGKVPRHVDAKSTSGQFSSSIYLSYGEIRHAVTGASPYDIYRLFKVTERSASMRVARDIGPKLAALWNALQGLPMGVRADTLSFIPDFFGFEDDVIFIEVQDDEENPEEID